MLTACFADTCLWKRAAAAEQGRNVALGAKYVLSPAPNYAACTDPGDATQLTDGKTTTAHFWTQRSTVGWIDVPYVLISVDLGRIEPIAGASFNTAAGAGGVRWPHSVQILVSEDGRTWRDAGDLVALDRKANGPLPEKYAIRRLSTSELHARGRYVCFVAVPGIERGYLVVDEIEVFRGPDEWLTGDPGGQPIRGVTQIHRQARMSRAIKHRFREDTQGVRKAIEDAGKISAPAKALLLSRTDALAKELDAAEVNPDDTFRAALPLDAGHARLFQLQAEAWRAAGAEKLSAVAAAIWDPVDLFAAPESSTAAIEVHTMRGEYRAGALNLYNSTDQPLQVRLKFEGLPGAPSPAYLTVHEAAWTDTVKGKPVVSALPEVTPTGGTWPITVLPGLVRQVWFTFHASDLAPGKYDGKVVLIEGDKSAATVPVKLRVWPLEFPRQTTLLLGGFSYTDGDGKYGVTSQNRPALLKHLQERFVNAPWASPAAMMAFKFPPGQAGAIQLDTRRMDDWIAQWPNARQYFVYLHAGDAMAGAKAGTAEFDRRVGAWISAWVRHLAGKGIGLDRLVLSIVDEPDEQAETERLITWARAILAAEPRVQIWCDPTYRDPRKIPKGLFEVCNILCPKRTSWLENPSVFEPFFLDQQGQGRTLQFYSCTGPAKLLDPYSYYRLQAWHGFSIGATGSFFWAFGDTSGSSSWNEYLANGDPFTPLFLDANSVVAGKQMEAIRESVEDYEYLVMLRQAAERAKKAGRDQLAAQAETLLASGPKTVLSAPGADQIYWHAPKDRTQADAVRIKILKMLEALR